MVLIAMVVAATVYALEQKRLRDVAVDLAVERAAQFATLAGDAVAAPDAARSSDVQARLNQFIEGRTPPREGRIVAASIRSADGNEAARFVYSGYPQGDAAAALLQAQPEVSESDAGSGQPIDVAGSRHYLVQIPLRTAEGDALGSLRAVFAPSDVYLSELRDRLWRAVIVAVAIVFMTTAILYPIVVRLMRKVAALSAELLDANLEMLAVIGSAIAKRDADTDAHNYRVTIYSVRLAEAAGVDTKSMQALIKGAFLHDVGKIGVPDQILLKPGKLDATEFAEMQKHVAHGLDIIGRAAWLADAEAVVGYHHEKYAGDGYSSRLEAENIPLIARIFAIADVFDALTSRRPYKEPLAFETTMNTLEQSRGMHFDPRLLDLFSGIARPLYAAFANRDDEHVRKVLRDIVVRYFKQDLAILL